MESTLSSDFFVFSTSLFISFLMYAYYDILDGLTLVNGGWRL